MYMMYMVRKQLYITEQQNRLLKRRARALGLSEAELVRRTLDQALREQEGSVSPVRREALSALLGDIHRIAQHHRLPEGFSRQTLYEEREQRWSRNKT